MLGSLLDMRLDLELPLAEANLMALTVLGFRFLFADKSIPE